MVFKEIIFQNRYVELETPLFMEKNILNFHFDYLHPSLRYYVELFCKDKLSNSLCSLYILPSPLGFCPVRVHLYSLEPIPTSPFLCLDLCSEDSDKYSISSHHSTPDLLQTLSENRIRIYTCMHIWDFQNQFSAN